MKLIRAKTGNLLRMLSGTFEPEKAKQIIKMGQSVRMKLEFNKQVVRDMDMFLVETVITFASYHCKLQMCEPHMCRRCQLGRVMDKLSWVSRGDRAWWEVFESKLREVAEEAAE